MPSSPPARLFELTPPDAERIVTWVPTLAEAIAFGGPQLPFPLTGPAFLAAAAGRRVLVLREDALAVATGSLRAVGEHTVRIGWVLVDPKRRGAGWGRRLLTALIAEAARSPDVSSLELGVYQHNVAARRLYDSLGFSDSGRRRHTCVDGELWTSPELTRSCADPSG